MPRAVAFLQLGSVIGPAIALGISAYLLHIFLDMAPISVAWGMLHGWQLILILVGLPGVFVAALIAFTLPDPPRRTIEGQAPGSAAPAPKNIISALVAAVMDYVSALAYVGRHWPVFGPMFGGLFIGALGAGTIQWMPIFYQRTFGWHPAKVAGLQSVVTPVAMVSALIVGVLIAERFAKKGRDDAAIRTQVIGTLVALPSVFSVLMPDPWLALGLGTLTFVGIGISSPSQNAALQIVCPAQMRGKVTSLFLFFYSVVGLGLAPALVGPLNDYVFPDAIKWSIFVLRIGTAPLAVFVIWLGMKPYGREVARLKALEAKGG
jgi:MFS family permease